MSADAVPVRVVETSLGIVNCTARLPFRFGIVTMRAAPLATLFATLEVGGERVTGVAADLLAYRWFDKRPERSLAQNCQDLITAIGWARDLATSHGPAPVFDIWRAAMHDAETRAAEAGITRLGAAFGVSMLERAMIDAVGRHLGLGASRLLRSPALGIDLGTLDPGLGGMPLAVVLPDQPRQTLHVRHTVGLIDALTEDSLAPEDRVSDGMPETLEGYLRHDGIRFLKIKVGGNLEADIERLEAITALIDIYGAESIRATLDGNEQYRSVDQFATLIEAIKSRPSLRTLHAAILFIEQPLERGVALDPDIAGDLEALGSDLPILIDEADDRLDAFADAIRLGYRGVSHKNCKGVFKSVLNRARVVDRMKRGGSSLFQSAEDLTTLPVVSVQADLAVVAALGLSHVERNGHHYFHGLDHLPSSEIERALSSHPRLYHRNDAGTARLKIQGGALEVGSLIGPGLGTTDIPDIAAMVPADSWRFESLGIDETAATAKLEVGR